MGPVGVVTDVVTRHSAGALTVSGIPILRQTTTLGVVSPPGYRLESLGSVGARSLFLSSVRHDTVNPRYLPVGVEVQKQYDY